MIKQCKHCGTRFRQQAGQGEFCCAGCGHVYRLIQNGGLGEYYRQQDRVGQPVGERPFSECDIVSIKQLQNQAAGAPDCKLSVNIQGMSCMGCAWLIEQLSRRQPGVLSAQVVLGSNLLRLNWAPGDFDLCSLAADLQKFGYRITDGVGADGYTVSPLAMRFALTLVFSLNGLLLAAAAGIGIGGEALRQLYSLLLLLCLVLTLLIGGSLFLKPAWGALLLRRFHSDSVPALMLLSLWMSSVISLSFAGPWLPSAALYFTVLPVLVFARWISDMLDRR